MGSIFGVLVVNKPQGTAYNVGDYVQAVAAKNILGNPKVNFIERETLKQYDGDQVKVILNGWFMHDAKQWPPSELIVPLPISMHINPSVYSKFSEKSSIDYLRSVMPIGCRDLSTRDYLLKNGIEAYFSGCLTLTLNKKDFNVIPEIEDTILVVDFLQNRGSVSHLLNRYDISMLDKLLRLPKAVFEKMTYGNSKKIVEEKLEGMDVNYLTTQFSISDPEHLRCKKAEYMLDMINSAKGIITSRIHVALPALALGTPVLFVDPAMDSSRFNGIKELLNSVSMSDFNAMNRNDILEALGTNKYDNRLADITENLKAKVNDFISR